MFHIPLRAQRRIKILDIIPRNGFNKLPVNIVFDFIQRMCSVCFAAAYYNILASAALVMAVNPDKYRFTAAVRAISFIRRFLLDLIGLNCIYSSLCPYGSFFFSRSFFARFYFRFWSVYIKINHLQDSPLRF